jgi:hypothetical protein
VFPAGSAHVPEAILAGIAERFGLGHTINAAEAVKLIDEELERAELRPDSPAAIAVLSTTAARFVVNDRGQDPAWYTAALQILLLAGADLDTARRLHAAQLT